MNTEGQVRPAHDRSPRKLSIQGSIDVIGDEFTRNEQLFRADGCRCRRLYHGLGLRKEESLNLGCLPAWNIDPSLTEISVEN